MGGWGVSGAEVEGVTSANSLSLTEVTPLNVCNPATFHNNNNNKGDSCSFCCCCSIVLSVGYSETLQRGGDSVMLRKKKEEEYSEGDGSKFKMRSGSYKVDI